MQKQNQKIRTCIVCKNKYLIEHMIFTNINRQGKGYYCNLCYGKIRLKSGKHYRDKAGRNGINQHPSTNRKLHYGYWR